MITRVGVSLLKLSARIIYAPMKLLPIQHKLVLISRLNSKTSIDFQQIIIEASTSHPDLRIIVLNHKMDGRIKHVFEILQEMYHLATSEACVVESYVISVSILRHKKSLKIVQIWHAIGAIKAFGHSALGKAEGSSKRIARLMNMHQGYGYVTAGSEATVPLFAAAFDVPEERVLPIGMPRIDYLLNESVQLKNTEKIRKVFTLPVEKQVILYAPTFRKRAKIPYQQLIDAIDFTAYSLIIKQHTHDKTKVKSQPGVVVLKDEFAAVELLPIADYVVTDYSAVAFEAALLEKPLFFWTFDLERYAKRRGFVLEYGREIPGVQNSSASEIMQAIEARQFDTQRIREFADRFCAVQDGTCTQRLLTLLEAKS
jgi:CDP-ribitol ribitolphosphotransferase